MNPADESGMDTTAQGNKAMFVSAAESGATGRALIDAVQAAPCPDLDFDLAPIRTTAPARDITL